MDIDTSLAAKRWGDVRYMEIGLEVVAQRRIQDSNLWGTEAPTAFPRRRHSPLGQFSRLAGRDYRVPGDSLVEPAGGRTRLPGPDALCAER